jgi:hypothetical protein
MSHSSEPIITAIRGGEVLALHQAIETIWKALDGVNAGALDGADLDDAIYAAVDLLPSDMRNGYLPMEKKFERKVPQVDQFEDLLG